MTRSDFIDWKASGVTIRVLATIEKQIRELEVVLGSTAGMDQLQDRYTAGYLRGLSELLNLEIELDEETQQEIE